MNCEVRIELRSLSYYFGTVKKYAQIDSYKSADSYSHVLNRGVFLARVIKFLGANHFNYYFRYIYQIAGLERNLRSVNGINKLFNLYIII